MSRKANCRDNATSESLFQQPEIRASARFTLTDSRADLFDYVEVFHNRSRRYAALGGQSPAAVYAAWLKIQSEPKFGGLNVTAWRPKIRWKFTFVLGRPEHLSHQGHEICFMIVEKSGTWRTGKRSEQAEAGGGVAAVRGIGAVRR